MATTTVTRAPMRCPKQTMIRAPFIRSLPIPPICPPHTHSHTHTHTHTHFFSLSVPERTPVYTRCSPQGPCRRTAPGTARGRPPEGCARKSRVGRGGRRRQGWRRSWGGRRKKEEEGVTCQDTHGSKTNHAPIQQHISHIYTARCILHIFFPPLFSVLTLGRNDLNIMYVASDLAPVRNSS